MTGSVTRYTQGRLIAIKDCNVGDVVYLRPDHPCYRPEWFAVIMQQPQGLGAAHAISPHQDGNIAPVFFPDVLRCVEKASYKRMAECTGLSHAEVRRAQARAKAGSPDPFLSLEAMVTELHDAQQPVDEADAPAWMNK